MAFRVLVSILVVAGLWFWSQVSWRSPSLAGGSPRLRAQERWATKADLKGLISYAKNTCRHFDQRLILGTYQGRARKWYPSWLGKLPERLVGKVGLFRFLSSPMVCVERSHSVLVVGPTQSHKTSGLAIPAILGWRGPVVAVSVKGDLVEATLQPRSSLGTCSVFDPSYTTRFPSQGWSPLSHCMTWVGARRIAHSLVQASPKDGVEEASFWLASAGKLLAPLLYGAANAGLTMSDVLRWVDTQEIHEVEQILESLPCDQARYSAWASFGRDPRHRSSIYSTAEVVLEAFGDTALGTTGPNEGFDPASLFTGNEDTLYVCAPSHEQARLRPVICALVDQVVNQAFSTAQKNGGKLVEPLLLVIDEAANVAPIHNLDTLASTGASHGIQLVTVWQDMAQIKARYGPRASSIVNNHRAKLFLSGISDLDTLEYVSKVIGDTNSKTHSFSRDHKGGHSIGHQGTTRQLAPIGSVRQVTPGSGILLYGHLPPARIGLRPWYKTQIVH